MQASAAEFLVRKRYDLWHFDDVRIEANTESNSVGEFTVHTRDGTKSGKLGYSQDREPFYTTCRSVEPAKPPICHIDSVESTA